MLLFLDWGGGGGGGGGRWNCSATPSPGYGPAWKLEYYMLTILTAFFFRRQPRVHTFILVIKIMCRDLKVRLRDLHGCRERGWKQIFIV